MFSDDSTEGETFDAIPFVGRDKERETVKQLIGHSVHAVQLTGQPMVGKARLAEEISKELQQEMDSKGKKLLCYHLCCSDISTLVDLLACLSACLSINETAETEKSLITHFQAIVKNDPTCTHLFVFLKCENLHKNSFYIQFVDILKKLLQVSKRVFMIVTTQKPFNISNSKQVNIEPLSKRDTVKLVRRYAQEVDVDPYVEAIEKHCYGLPPLAMDAAQELSKAKVPYTAEEFAELLSTENRSRRIHSDEDVLNSVALSQFEGLNDFLKKRIIDISIFKGSFRVDDILKMIGDSRTEAKKNLNEMASCGLVEYEDGGQRMRLQTVISHYIRNLMGIHVTYDDTVRLRFVTLFVDVLKKADSELFIKPQQTVFGYLHDDWPNLKQVLEEAIHCTEHTYSVFLKVALSAENLLVKCFPGEAVKFYEAMMMASTKFGTREECAMQKWLLGMAKTIGKGTDLVEAMGLFREALPILSESENPEALVSLLADMGLNYNRQGINAKSRMYYLQALEESGRCTDGRKLTNRIINIRCYLAIPMIFLEHFDEAENLLKETLEQSRKVAPYHPSIPIMINSLGLIYERAGRSDDEALRYYQNSLAERRKYADVAPGDLVVVLNNVAMQHSKRGNHDYAIKLLSEAREIRMKIERVNYHTALTCWDMGQVYGRKREYRNALSEITDALDIFKKCTKSHFVIVEVLLQAAHFASCLKLYNEAEKYLLGALELEEKYKDLHPTGSHILLVLQHLLMLYMSFKKQCSPFLDRAVAEASRLLENSRPSDSLDRNAGYWQNKVALYRIRSVLDQNVVEGEMLKELLSELLGFCYICEDLKSRGEDVVTVFHSMTTSVCSDLESAETLLRSHALSVATSVLRGASGTSGSPPVSLTRDLSDPPSYYIDKQRVVNTHGVGSPQYQDQVPMPGAYVAQVSTHRGDNPNTYLKEMPGNCMRNQELLITAPQNSAMPSHPAPENIIYQSQMILPDQNVNMPMQMQHETHASNIPGCRLNAQQYTTNEKHFETNGHRAYQINGQFFIPSGHGNGQYGPRQYFPNHHGPFSPSVPTPHVQRFSNSNIAFDHNSQNTRLPNGQEFNVPSDQLNCKLGRCQENVTAEQKIHKPGSLGIKLELLNTNPPQSRNTQIDQADVQQTKLSRQKTVDEVWNLSREQPQEWCPSNGVRNPPSRTFPKLEDLSQNQQLFNYRVGQELEDLIKQTTPQTGNASIHTGSGDFHVRFEAHRAVLQRSKSTSKPISSHVICEEVCDGSSSGYGSPAAHAHKRFSESSQQLSSAPGTDLSAESRKEALENDDRLLGDKECCSQPECACSLSKIPL